MNTLDTIKKNLERDAAALGDYAEVTKLMRDAPPSHSTLKIQSFSLFSELKIQKYKSRDIELKPCNIKWKLVLYPNGDKEMNVNDHISLYLVVANSKSLLPDWDVTVAYRFFIFDQIKDKYLSLGDVGGTVRRFHSLRNKCGFAKLISLATFKAAENGFLVNDTCKFGLEIFVVHGTAANETFSLLKSAACYHHTWKFGWYSNAGRDYITSETIIAGDRNWNIRLYPKGEREAKNKNLSLFIYLMYPGTRVYAEIRLRLKNQTEGKHREIHGYYWFENPSKGRGARNFIAIHDFYNRDKGYLVNDICIIEAEITVHGSRK